MPVNADTFDKMVDEDIDWLKQNAPESHIYRDHIIKCLEMAKKHYREVQLPNMPDSEWDC
ncbi:MAG: hypothetical protein COA47_10260 [Robiginitomaculum sp.]|nr:MAG: hypothetical protein COA47_10260 [Robiginitomaculum sp.]